jgi:transcriptional regulator with XRE-family HTH domain
MGAISQAFKLALLHKRAAGVRIHEIARACDVRPNELSGLVCGSMRAKPDDGRILRVAAYLGLDPDCCFEREDAPPAAEPQPRPRISSTSIVVTPLPLAAKAR